MPERLGEHTFARQLASLRAEPEADLRAGDLVAYGPAEGADHIAFWLGDGRILHATGRAVVESVVGEEEPQELRERRRALVRVGPRGAPSGWR